LIEYRLGDYPGAPVGGLYPMIKGIITAWPDALKPCRFSRVAQGHGAALGVFPFGPYLQYPVCLSRYFWRMPDFGNRRFAGQCPQVSAFRSS
jgi:hypothetical protein